MRDDAALAGDGRSGTPGGGLGQGAAPDAPPAACSLEDDRAVERVLEFARLLVRALVRRDDFDGGVRLFFVSEPRLEADVRELTQREKACCEFFEFALRADGGGVQLEVRAPAEARPMLDALFRPLAGRRILVTRPPGQAAELVAALERLGAEAVVRSTIDIRPLQDPSALDGALRRLPTYDWVVFTSRNGVRHVWERFEALEEGLERALEYGEEGRSRGGLRVAAIGPGTASALEARGARADYVPSEYVAEALAEELPGVTGARVLLLRADIARPALRDLLGARGAEVDDVAAYRTVQADGPAAAKETGDADALAATKETGPDWPAATKETRGADAVTFTSPSTVRGFLRAEGGVLEGVAVVCIGPVTARAAREAGLTVDAVAESYTVAGLVEALVRLFASGHGLGTRPAGRNAGGNEETSTG